MLQATKKHENAVAHLEVLLPGLNCSSFEMLRNAGREKNIDHSCFGVREGLNCCNQKETEIVSLI